MYGQEQDAGLWTNITIEKKITRNLDATFTQEFRFDENITELGTFFSDAGIEYKFWKGFKAGIFYRYGFRQRPDGSFSQRHRVYFDLGYKRKFKRFEAGYRVRIQTQYSNINRSEAGNIPFWYLRQKVHFGYNTKSRFDPYLDGEVWYRISPGWSRFDNFRISAGVVARICKHHSVDLGYIIEHEFNVTFPVTSFISFLGYKISF